MWSLIRHARAPHEDTVDELWDGLDVAIPHNEGFDASVPNTSINVISQAMPEKQEPRLKGIQIAGMYDTGTNLLAATLKKNLGVERFQQLCPINRDGSGHCFFNKHFAPRVLDEALDKLDLDLLLVAMVRSPLSSITSWKKAPYGLSDCIYTTNILDDQATICQVEGGRFEGVSGVWNAYTENYESLGARHPRHKVMVVEYERLVLEPESVIKSIAGVLGVQLVSASVQIITAPAKMHGAAVGRDKAIEKLRTMSYLRMSPIAAIPARRALCRNLNASVMKRHLVPLTPDPRTYAADCDV